MYTSPKADAKMEIPVQVASQEGFDLTEGAESHRPLLGAIRRNDPEEAHQSFIGSVAGWSHQAMALYAAPERPVHREHQT